MRSGCERSLGVETGASALTRGVGQLSGTLGLLPVLSCEDLSRRVRNR